MSSSWTNQGTNNFLVLRDPMVDVCLSEVVDGEDIEEQDWHGVVVPDMTAVADLDEEQQRQFAQLKEDCKDIFATVT